MGLGRLELPTSPLSGVRSNQLSYRPNTYSLTEKNVAGLPTSPSFPFKVRGCALTN